MLGVSFATGHVPAMPGGAALDPPVLAPVVDAATSEAAAGPVALPQLMPVSSSELPSAMLVGLCWSLGRGSLITSRLLDAVVVLVCVARLGERDPPTSVREPSASNERVAWADRPQVADLELDRGEPGAGGEGRQKRTSRGVIQECAGESAVDQTDRI